MLNGLEAIDLVHLRAGWFLENLLVWMGAVARYARTDWLLDPDLKTPWVAVRDIAGVAAREFATPPGEHRTIREVGSEDLTMPEIAAIMGKAIGCPVDYVLVDRRREDIKAEYLAKFGNLEHRLDDNNSLDALNDGRVRFPGDRAPLPITMETFIETVWMPRYQQALVAEGEPETFQNLEFQA